ncbi:protein S100-A10-like [Protopterus annectens]|uniref:protein S100-A10-like n=1 Tax=Protopterus annectens TaxID=7888 RepID=UPI001CFC0FB8|nr:protein S100-A10-like [Protopterus annectens]
MPTDMEEAMQKLLIGFHTYAGEKGFMTREECKRAITVHFADLAKNCSGAMDNLVTQLDVNGDNKISLSEFLCLCGGLTEACLNEEWKCKQMPAVPPQPATDVKGKKGKK